MLQIARGRPFAMPFAAARSRASQVRQHAVCRRSGFFAKSRSIQVIYNLPSSDKVGGKCGGTICRAQVDISAPVHQDLVA